jgi:protoporphyrinogen/coproporphyrinogen III oxidase
VTRKAPAVVVGGGISGLACAYALSKAGVDVLLLEAASRTGGVIRSERREGFLVELGPQSFSGTPPLLALCTELGLRDEMLQAPSAAPRYVLVKGRLQSVPLSPPELLSSSLLGVGTKLKLGRDAVGNSKPPDGDESIADFVRRKFTDELLDRLVGPFVSGIYAGDPERLSLRSAFPQVYQAEKSAGSVIRGLKLSAKGNAEPRERPTLLSFRGGTETLIQALNERLGNATRTSMEVLGVTKNASTSSFEVTIRSSGNEESIATNCLILATPTVATGDLLRNVHPDFGHLLSGIEYAPIAVVALGYRRTDITHSLDGFGFLVPRSSPLRTLGTVWNSSLFAGRTPEGQVLLTSFIGGATDPEAATLSPESLATLVHKEIAPLLGIQQSAVFSNVTSYPQALPQYNLGHFERMANIEKLCRSAAAGVWLAGNYLRGPSIGACVEQSQAVAQDVLSHLAR